MFWQPCTVVLGWTAPSKLRYLVAGVLLVLGQGWLLAEELLRRKRAQAPADGPATPAAGWVAIRVGAILAMVITMSLVPRLLGLSF
jgi:hypothetical protein